LKNLFDKSSTVQFVSVVHYLNYLNSKFDKYEFEKFINESNINDDEKMNILELFNRIHELMLHIYGLYERQYRISEFLHKQNKQDYIIFEEVWELFKKNSSTFLEVSIYKNRK
jgi:hypothetical protein